MNGIMERLEPQFFLRENAEWAGAQPMVWLEPHWHYFRLCAEVSEQRLENEVIVRGRTRATIRALNTQGMRWLGNIPLDALIELRKRNENVVFRKRMQEFTAALHQSMLEDVDRVAAEVSHGIASLVAEHQSDLARIEDKYRPRYLATAGSSWLTMAAEFLPSSFPSLPELPPAVGHVVAPLALASAYMKAKVDERNERRVASRSLTGVLAAATKQKSP